MNTNINAVDVPVEECVEGGAKLTLPLKTPDKRHLLTQNTFHEVRKRTLPLSSPGNSPPPDDDYEGDMNPKKRLVSKTLTFGSSSALGGLLKKSSGGAARCIFGAPLAEENELVRKAFDEKIQHDFDAFANRWGLLNETDEKVAP